MELEQEVGKQLLVRGKRKITLTEEGVLLRKRADEIITLLEKTEREPKRSSPEKTGNPRIFRGEQDKDEVLSDDIYEVF